MKKSIVRSEHSQPTISKGKSEIVEELAYYRKHPTLCSMEHVEQFAEDRELVLTNEHLVGICDELSEEMTWVLYGAFQKVLGDVFQG